MSSDRNPEPGDRRGPPSSRRREIGVVGQGLDESSVIIAAEKILSVTSRGWAGHLFGRWI